MTAERLLEWARLMLKRESLSPESPERDRVDDDLDSYWFDATEEERKKMIKFIEQLDVAMAPFIGTPPEVLS